MKTLKNIKFAGLLVIMSLFFTACSSAEDSYTSIGSNNVVYKKSGAQLWGENCVRCHSIPSPDSYNDTDWNTIELHMKVRANLTSIESEKAFEFLKSAN